MRTPPKQRVLLQQTYGRTPYVMMAANPPLSVYAHAVYPVYVWHGAGYSPSIAVIQRMAGTSGRARDGKPVPLSRATVIAASRELEDRGFLRRQGGGKGRRVEWVLDDVPPSLVWEPVTSGHRLRHERDQPVTGRDRSSHGSSPVPGNLSRVVTPPISELRDLNSTNSSKPSLTGGAGGPDRSTAFARSFRSRTGHWPDGGT